MAKAKSTKTSAPAIPQKPTWAMIIDAASRFGISGAIIICLLYTFMVFGTASQHQEFIDKFILIKIPKNDNIFAFFVIFIQAILLVSAILYYNKRLKIKEERISYLENDVRSLQENLLKR